MELNKIQEKNNEIFESFFKKVFGEDFKVVCNGGFPNLELQITQETEERKTIGEFGIDVSKRNYRMRTYGSKKENEVWTPEFTIIDSSTIEYIVDSSIELSNRIFGTNSEETKKVE